MLTVAVVAKGVRDDQKFGRGDVQDGIAAESNEIQVDENSRSLEGVKLQLDTHHGIRGGGDVFVFGSFNTPRERKLRRLRQD